MRTHLRPNVHVSRALNRTQRVQNSQGGERVCGVGRDTGLAHDRGALGTQTVRQAVPG